jgi:hypothetical protein
VDPFHAKVSGPCVPVPCSPPVGSILRCGLAKDCFSSGSLLGGRSNLRYGMTQPCHAPLSTMTDRFPQIEITGIEIVVFPSFRNLMLRFGSWVPILQKGDFKQGRLQCQCLIGVLLRASGQRSRIRMFSAAPRGSASRQNSGHVDAVGVDEDLASCPRSRRPRHIRKHVLRDVDFVRDSPFPTCTGPGKKASNGGRVADRRR